MAESELDLAELYARHRVGLFTLALSITRCAGRAEDAVHDAFEKLSRTRQRIERDPVPLVFAAVRSAAIDICRKVRVRAAGPVADSIFATTVDDPASAAIRSEQDQSIAAAVEQLPDDLRELVVLRVYAGLTLSQVAQMTGEPLQTIASRYRRTLEKLRLSLGRLA